MVGGNCNSISASACLWVTRPAGLCSGVAARRLRHLLLLRAVAAQPHIQGRVEAVQAVAVLLLQLGKSENLETVALVM